MFFLGFIMGLTWSFQMFFQKQFELMDKFWERK